MYERSQEFVFASRTQNWKLHLESCQKLSVDFHATDRIKYMRMFPYYIKTQLALEEWDTATWKWLNEGQFSVVKSRLPFVGIGVDHAGEQQNKMLKVSGGLRGIAINANAGNRFFATASILRALCSASETKKHYNISMSKARKQEARIEKLTKSIELHLSPFSSEDTGTLRNMYTNAVVKEEYITGIINVIELGKKSLKTFTQERLMTHSKIPFWSTVGRNKFPNFHQAVLEIRSGEELIKGIDGVIRAAKLKTGRNSGFITRPLKSCTR